METDKNRLEKITLPKEIMEVLYQYNLLNDEDIVTRLNDIIETYRNAHIDEHDFSLTFSQNIITHGFAQVATPSNSNEIKFTTEVIRIILFNSSKSLQLAKISLKEYIVKIKNLSDCWNQSAADPMNNIVSSDDDSHNENDYSFLGTITYHLDNTDFGITDEGI
jgi:hypothetical protein